jgi:archaellin
MWKIALAFVAFAALALFVIMQAGDKVDMRGESAAHEQTEQAAPAAPAAK